MYRKYNTIVIISLLLVGSFANLFPLLVRAEAEPGWDFEDHTYSHPYLPDLNATQIASQLQRVNDAFQANGLPIPEHIAYPYGDFNQDVINVVRQYRRSGRTGGSGFINFPETYPVADWYRLSAVNFSPEFTWDQIRGWIDQAIAERGLLNLFTHKVLDNPAQYDSTIEMFTQILDYLVTKQNAGQLSVMTLRDAYNSFDGSKAIVVISFDDGYENTYSVAWPMMKARGLKGTTYIIAGIPTDYQDPNYTTWEQIREMAQPTGPTTWSVSIASNPSGGGTTTPSGLQNVTGTLTVTAYPAANYTFRNWQFDGSNITSNPLTLPEQGNATNHTLTAFFIPLTTWSVSIASSPPSGGTTTPSGLQNVTSGSLTVTAYPAANYTLVKWQFDGSNMFANPLTIPQQARGTNHTLTAFFTSQPLTATLVMSRTAGGIIYPKPGNHTYNVGTVVDLEAIPNTGYHFVHWNSSGLVYTDNPHPLLLSYNKTYSFRATFAPNEYSLTVIVSPAGSGSVSRNNTGPYYYGNKVQLTANPNAGWVFSSWSGDLTGSANPAVITMNSNKTVTATFTQLQYALTVTISPVGIGTVSLNNTGPYYYGDEVQLTAVPSLGWVFSNWTGDLSGSVNPAVIIMDSNKSVTAIFIQSEYTLTVIVSPVGGGSVSLNNSGPYYYGDSVQLTAVPTIGWVFFHWGGNLSGSTNPITITMDGNKTVIATFSQLEYTLAVTISPVEGGSVSRNNSGPYHYGDEVQLTAVPTIGWAFSSWTGDLTGSINPVIITMNGNKTVTATFTQLQYTLTVSVSPVGSGSVNLNNTGPYYYGDNVQLTAVPTSGWTFFNWSGDLSDTVNPIVITMNGNKTVTATFTQFSLTVTVSPVGSGSVTLNDTDPYYYGDIVELTAVPTVGWVFSSWSGDLTGSINPAILTMNGNKTVTAIFTQLQYSLTVTVSPVSGGSVSRNNTGPYYYGDKVQLTATPTLGWAFSFWNGDLTGSSNPAVITIDGNKTVTANFTQLQYTLTVTVSPIDGGSVSRNSSGPYYYGDKVQLLASPNLGWAFSGWTGDVVSSNNPIIITVDDNKTITASFTRETYSLTLSVSPVGSGSVSLNNTGPYYYGDAVRLTATPTVGWMFTSWSGHLSGSVNPAVIIIDANKTVTATFIQLEYTLIVTVSPPGSGSVNLNNTGPYHYGDIVELGAVPSLGWSFSLWSGDLSGTTNPASTFIDGNKTVAAYFIMLEYTLTVTISPASSGSVNLNNTGPYHYGDEVQLTAVPTVGWAFSSWSGDLSGSINPAVVTMNGNKTITAIFTQLEFTLTVNVSPTGSGLVSLNNTGPYHYGDSVQLTAVPTIGWAFSSWSGDLSSSANPSVIIIDGNKSVTANFTQLEYSLTVNVFPDGGGSVSLNVTGPYHYGDWVELTAVPTVGWAFSSWSGDLTGSANPSIITMNGNKTVTATFTQYTLTVIASPIEGGSIFRNASEPYYYGERVQLTALPSLGWYFSSWSGDLTGNTNPDVIIIDGNKTVTANFIRLQYTLTVAVSPMGGGSVTLNNTGPYYYGDKVELTATPTVGWMFTSWSGDLSGSVNPAVIIIDANKTVTATFVQLEYTLNVTVSPIGGGAVTRNYTGPYHYGDIVQLTAVPTIGWALFNWTGDLSGSLNPVVIIIDGNKSVTANFIQLEYTLAVTLSPIEGGFVSRNNTGPYHYGDWVRLTAVANPGWLFSQWSGDASGTSTKATIFIDGNKSVTASFTQIEYTLTVTVSPVGGGTVSRNNTGPYYYGDKVLLTATPTVGWTFSGWSGDLSGTISPAVITIDSDKVVIATFTQEEYTLIVTVSPAASGSVSLNATGPYHYGDVVELTASPTTGWVFSNWSGDISSTTNPNSITIIGNMTVTAHFTQLEYTLNVTVSPIGGGSLTLNNTGPYHYGDQVQLTATPTVGYSFSYWSGDLSGSMNPSVIIIDGNKTVTANFTQLEYTLTVTVYPIEGGSVSLNNSGPYYYGDVVQLNAIPTIGWVFYFWSGDLTGSDNPAVITMNGNKTVTATFTQYILTLTVSPTGSGSVNLNNTGPYYYGDNVQLTATPTTGWTFSSWSGDLNGSINPVVITMNGNKTVTANFTQLQYTLTATISPFGSGSVSLNKTGPYVYGEWIEVTALPSAGWRFSGWSGDLSGTTSPMAIYIDSNKSVTANFTQLEYTLTVTISPVNGGSVNLNNTGPYHYGDKVELTPVPMTGWAFSSWSGDLSGSVNPAVVTIDANKTVTAAFIQLEYTLTVTVSPEISGSITLNYTGPYYYGATVELTAVPNSGWRFSFWSGDLSGTTNPAAIYIDGNKTATANFIQLEYTLTVTVSPVDGGSIIRNSTGPYHYGDTVQLTAVSNLGWSFSSWSGDLLGNTNPAVITMNGNKTITAAFTQNEYTLTVTVSPIEGGSVSRNASEPYHYGDKVQLTASPNSGWRFNGWTGDIVSTDNPVVITIDGNKTVTAAFTQLEYTLTVTISPAGSGSVSLNNTGPYHYGDKVELIAVPSSGWAFFNWTGDLSGSINPAVIAIDGNKTVTANFIHLQYTLTITVSPVGGGSVTLNNTGPYYYGDKVELTGTPSVGWVFSSWSGDLTGSVNPAIIIMDGNKSVAATFTQLEYTLTVTVSPISSGSVSLNTTGPYYYGDVIELTATPAVGYSFSYWSGDLSGNTSPSVIIIDGNKTVTANFVQLEYTLTVTPSPIEGGSISLNATGPYHYGDNIQLTAVPSLGWSFTSWSGDLSGIANPAVIFIDGNKPVTANFIQLEYMITIAVSPTDSGSVNLNNTGPYHYGDKVQLTAVPITGWAFSSWSGDLTGSVNPAIITIDGNKTVTATFTQLEYMLTVEVSPIGSGSISLNNTGSYHYGDWVELTAVPGLGWGFSLWSGDLSGTVNPTAIYIDGNKTVAADFIQLEYALTVSFYPDGSGSVNLNNTGPYHYGDQVQLTATPTVGWAFTSWSGDLSGSVNPAVIIIDANKTVTAAFIQLEYTLTVSVSPIGGGSVSRNSTGPYHYGDEVLLTAVPTVGWAFSSWNGDLTGSVNPTVITMTSNKSVTADFIQLQYSLTVTVSPPSSGSVNLNNTDPYYYGDIVELTAVPSLGWSFSLWSGDLSGSINPASIFIDGNKTVIANFIQLEYTLSVAVSPIEGGSGSLNATGPYHYGDNVQLTAVPTIGWAFSSWSGDLTGSLNPAVITMTSNKSVTAIFTQNEYTLTVTVSSPSSGSVNLNNTGPYHYGDQVQLTAFPNAGWAFSTWSGDLTGSVNPAIINMNGNKTVTATFTQLQYTLTATVSPVGSGSVNLNKTGPYNYGDWIELTALPNAGWKFSFWSGDLSGTANPASIFIDGNKTATANFIQLEYTLTVTVSPENAGSVGLNASGPYHYGDWVKLTASANAGWSFENWTGDTSGTVNPVDILIDGNKSVTANFIQSQYTLAISTTTGGTTDPAPGTYTYLYGIIVNVTAIPDAGDGIHHYWMLDGSDAGSASTISVEMNANHTLQAVFGSQHDIGIQYMNLSTNLVGKGYNVTITVNVVNKGINDETFNLTVFANATIVQTKTITLTRGSTKNITFTWNTTSFAYGNYIMSAVADTIPGETETLDNSYTGGTVLVTIPGDVDGDRTVDVFDILKIKYHRSGPPPGPGGYDPNADINGDGTIDVLDILIAQAHLGQSW